jgi:hypothetical protein
VAVPLIVVAVAAAGWCAFWYSAAGQADRLVAEWIDREAKLGRIYDCGSRQIEGFPFHIVLRCDEARAQLNNLQPPIGLNLSDVEVTAYLYQPTVLSAEFSGPIAIGEPGQAPKIVADWELARTNVRGTPRAPERISVLLDKPVFERVVGENRERIVTGEHVELNVRIASGTPAANPVLDVGAKVVATAAPGVHPLVAEATDADIDTRLYGLKDFAPKSWPDRFREVQQANGRIEVRSVRVSQREWVATGSGSIGLTAAGRLNGEISVTVAGLDKLMKQLGVEYIARSERANSAIGMLNQLIPGLGDAAREHASTGAAAGLALFGEQTELEGKKATRLPLRFEDGAISLGPIPIGRTEPLF